MEWANIRSGPSMDYEVLRAVATGYPLLVLDRQNEWSMVEDYRRRKGWVASKLLAKNNSVILKISQGKLLAGPGPEDEIIKEVERGTILQIKEVQEDWLKVVDRDGNTGWIHRSGVWPE